MADLSSEYIELPYIESDGTQYIDTGYCPQYASISSLYFTLMDYPNANNNGIVFGIKDTANDTNTSLAITSGTDENTTGTVTMTNSGNVIEWLGLINTSTNYDLMWYNDEMYIQNIKGGYQSYAGRPGQLFKDGEGIAITTNLNLYLLALNDNGTATNMFKGRIYRVKLTDTSRYTLIRDYIPCMRISDKKLGLYDLVTETFVTNATGNDFTCNEQAVNIASFCNYIVSLCTYLNGTALSSSNKTQLYNYLIDGLTPGILLNIKTALAILNKINTYADSTITLSLSDSVLKYALNISTAKTLVNIAFPSDNRDKFCTLNHIYDDTGNLNDYNFMQFTFYFPKASSDTAYYLEGTLIGAGGGGSGGLSGDNAKNINVTTTGGSGYQGGTTTLEYTPKNGTTTTYEAAGGAGGSINSLYHEGNAPYKRNGYKGTDGNTTDIDIQLSPQSTLKITPGNGGSGGGGCVTKINYNSSRAAGNATETAAGNGASYNSWPSDDWAYATGGGAGGSATPGSSSYSGPSGRATAGSPSVNGVGGKAGYGDIHNSDQPATIGAGGFGGNSSYKDDTVCNSNGGNGGNNGSFKINTVDTDPPLFIWKQ